jgi:hypothetical protein
MDWMGVASLWIGAFVFAAKSVGAEAPSWAPGWFSSGVWNFVPLVLISIAVLLFGRRLAIGWDAAKATSNRVEMPSSIALAPEPERLTLPMESPNINLPNAMTIVMHSTWAEQHGAKVPDALREMADKLSLHKLTAFGRRMPDARIEPIPHKRWASLEVSLSHKAAVDAKTKEVAFHDLQFDSDYVNGVWRSADSWMG